LVVQVTVAEFLLFIIVFVGRYPTVTVLTWLSYSFWRRFTA